MKHDLLINAIRNYLAAEEYHDEVASDGSNSDWAAHRCKTARRELQQHLNAPNVQPDHPLVKTFKSYLEGAPGREADRIREDLKVHLDASGITQPQRQILVAVDDSDQATWAVEAAIRLAGALRAKIILLNVNSPLDPFIPDGTYASADFQEMRRAKASDILRNAKSLIPPTIEWEAIAEEGDPVVRITEFAREAGVNYIVIGTHGRGRVAQLLVGSTASGVARQAHCPVITVSRPVKPESPREAELAQTV